MPRKTKTSKDRCQAITSSKRISEQCQVNIEEPEEITGRYKQKIKEKEEAITPGVVHTKKSLSRMGPPNQNSDLPKKSCLSKVGAINDAPQATTSQVISIYEVFHKVSDCNSQEKLCSSKGKLKINRCETVLSCSNLDVLETIPSVLEQKQKDVPLIKRKYTRRTNDCDAKIIENEEGLNSEITIEDDSNSEIKIEDDLNSDIKIEDDLNSEINIEDDLNSEIKIEADDFRLDEMPSDIQMSQTQKSCSVKSILKKIESETAPNNSNPYVLESTTLTVHEQKPVEPRVKRKYTRRSKMCDTETNKDEDDFLTSLSNSNPDVLESTTLTVQEQKPVEPRVKRKYTRRTKRCGTKTNKNEDDFLSTVSDSNMDVEEFENVSSVAVIQSLKLKSTSDDVQKQDMTPRVKRKYNKRIRVSDAKSDDSLCSLSSKLDDKESKDASTQMKNGAQKHIRLCSNTKDSVTERESSLSNPHRCATSSAQDVKEVTPHHSAQKCKKQKKVSFAKTCTKLGESQSTSSNVDHLTQEIKLEFLPIITESCKKHIKNILLTAVQFQRHSRRKTLSEADVSKALAFYRDFKVDSDGDVEHVIKSESVSDDEEEEDESLLFCHGKWLHQ